MLAFGENMSVSATKRRQRVRLSDPVSSVKRRQRVRLDPPTEEEMIAEFIRTNGITHCPPAAVETVRGLYTRKTESDRLQRLEVEAGKDPDKQQKLKEYRMRIMRKTEAWIQLLKREGKPIPKELVSLTLRKS